MEQDSLNKIIEPKVKNKKKKKTVSGKHTVLHLEPL